MTCRFCADDYKKNKISKSKFRITQVVDQEVAIVFYCIEGETEKSPHTECMLANSIILDESGNRFIVKDLEYRTKIDNKKILKTRISTVDHMYTITSKTKAKAAITINDFTFLI